MWFDVLPIGTGPVCEFPSSHQAPLVSFLCHVAAPGESLLHWWIDPAARRRRFSVLLQQQQQQQQTTGKEHKEHNIPDRKNLHVTQIAKHDNAFYRKTQGNPETSIFLENCVQFTDNIPMWISINSPGSQMRNSHGFLTKTIKHPLKHMLHVSLCSSTPKFWISTRSPHQHINPP